VLFDSVLRFVFDGWQNRATKLGKSATETLEMLHEALEEHSLSGTAALNGIDVSGPVQCQSKMTIKHQ
jgi:hypothetical protein